MKTKKSLTAINRFLAVFMAMLMVMTSLAFAEPVKAAVSDDGKLLVNADGSFRILQIPDVQDGGYLTPQILATIRLSIRKTRPNLIVLTGDNVNEDNNYVYSNYQLKKTESFFKNTVDVLVNEFVDTDGNIIPFAVTYGNHDTEYNDLTLKQQDAYFKQKGALTLNKNLSNGSTLTEVSASDNSSVTYGTGYLDIYDEAGEIVVKRVILVNSGTYAAGTASGPSKYGKAGYYSYPKKSAASISETYGEQNYNNIVAAVNDWTSDESIQVIGFQHIALQEIYLGDSNETRLLKPDANGITGGPQIKSGSASISGNYSLSTSNPTVQGAYNEWTGCSYYSTWELYKAFAKPNVAGLFYGHDHLNYMTGVTTITKNGTAYSLMQGNGGGQWVYEDYTYSGANPMVSAFTLEGYDNTLNREYYSYRSLSVDGAVYPSDGSVKYISDVAIFRGTSFIKAMSNARAAGYIPVTRFYNQSNYYADLNQYGDDKVDDSYIPPRPAGDEFGPTPYLCLAYKTTTDPDRAITDIRADYNKATEASPTKTYSVDGLTFTYSRFTTDPNFSTADANSGVNGGKVAVTLYYTKDKAAGAPIVDLCPIFRVNGDCYKYANTFNYGDYRELQICSVMETFTSNGKFQLADLNNWLSCDNYLYVFLCRYDGVTSIYAEPDVEDVVTAVPETIYLQPASSATTFQYYVNNTIDGNGNISLDVASNASTGKVFFYCPNASEVSVRAKSGEGSNAATLNSISIGSVNTDVSMTPVSGKPGLFELTVTSGTVGGISAGNSKQIKWVFTYTTMSGLTKTQIAYSTVYSPITNVAGAAGEVGKGSGWLGSILWVQGINNGIGNVPDTSSIGSSFSETYHTVQKTSAFDPMRGVIDDSKKANNPTEVWLANATDSTPNKTFNYACYKNTSATKYTVFVPGHTANYIIDSSRYNNINQLPNVKTGFFLADQDGVQSLSKKWYLSIYTLDGANDKYYLGTTQGVNTYADPTLSSYACSDKSTDTVKKISSGNRSNDESILYNGVFSYPINGAGSYEFGVKGFVGVESKNFYNVLYAPVHIDAVDKSELRGLIDSLLQSMALNGENGSYIDPSGRQASTILPYIRDGYFVLGKPNATDTEVNNAYKNLYGYYTNNQFRRQDVSTSTITVQYKYVDELTGTEIVLHTEKAEVNNGTKVITAARDFPGYEKPEVIYQSAMVNGDAVFTFYYSPIVYWINPHANGGIGAEPSIKQNIKYGVATPLTRNAWFTREGYEFSGWNTKADGTGRFFADCETVINLTTVSEGIDFYAQWIPVITFANYDGTVLQQRAYDYGTIPSYDDQTPTKDYDDNSHYTFSGWSPAISEVTVPVTYTAQFTAIEHNHSQKVSTAASPTCVNPGTAAYRCSCGRVIILPDLDQPAYGHTEVIDNAVAPTINNIGFTQGKHCSVCDEVIEAQEIIPPIAQTKVYESATKILLSNDAKYIGVTNTEPSIMASTEALSAGSSANGTFGTLSVTGGKASYQVETMEFNNVDTFWVLIKVTAPENYAGITDVWTYQKITVIPSRTLYYEDTFVDNGITYTSGEGSTAYGTWREVGEEKNIEALTFSEAYSDSLLYSMGSAHKVSVSNLNSAGWPKLIFTFAGTGFDVISHTDSNSGIFAISVYKGTEATGNKVKSKIIDTYRGYSYEALFYDEINHTIVANSGTPLYETDDKVNYDVKANGKYYSKTSNGKEQAMGWLLTGNADAIYQVPVMSITGLEYGTYTVTVEARFTTLFGHFNTDGDEKYYDLTVDAIRIYDPVNPEGQIADNYYDSDVRYELIRDSIVTSVGSGAILLDGGKIIDASELEEFMNVMPNNELYISDGKSVTFDIDTNGFKDVAVGMRAASGRAVTVQILFNGNQKKELTINSSTELYESLSALGISGTVVIKNVSGGVLSLTKVRTESYKTSDAKKAPMFINEETAPRAFAMLRMVQSDLSIDEDSITKTANEDGKITLSVTTGKDVSTLIVRDENGNEVTPDEINSIADGESLIWTVVLTESESGKYTYTLEGAYENGYTDGNTVTIELEVNIKADEPIIDEPTDDDTDTHKSLSVWERILKIIKRILTALFGVNFD